jgi:hypothetical protein
MIDARLRPARHIVFAEPVKKWEVFYEQQYAQVGTGVWLPVDFRANGVIHVDIDDQGYEEAQLALVSQLSAYRLNDAVLDSLVFEVNDRVILDSAFVLETLPFLPNGNMIPLSPRETDALGGLMQRKMTIEDAFLEGRTLAEFAQFERQRNSLDENDVQWPGVYGYRPWLRFNRVDGFFLGAGRTFTFSPQLDVEVRAAQTTGLEKIRLLSSVTYRSGSRITYSGSYSADTSPTVSRSKYSKSLASISSLTGHRDYFDHYWSKRITGRVQYALNWLRLSTSISSAQIAGVEKEIKKVWPHERLFRDNPTVAEGRDNSIVATVSFGAPSTKFRLEPVNRIGASIEHSNASVLQSDFTYTRLRFDAETNVYTLFRSRPIPSALRVRVEGTADLQDKIDFRLPSIDGSLSTFSTFGSLRSLPNRYYSAEKTLTLFWEHSFGIVPFELLGIPVLRRITHGVRVHGGHVVISDPFDSIPLSQSARIEHHEIGVGLAQLFGLPIRADVSFRLDEPGTYLTFGIEKLWGRN